MDDMNENKAPAARLRVILEHDGTMSEPVLAGLVQRVKRALRCLPGAGRLEVTVSGPPAARVAGHDEAQAAEGLEKAAVGRAFGIWRLGMYPGHKGVRSCLWAPLPGVHYSRRFGYRRFVRMLVLDGDRVVVNDVQSGKFSRKVRSMSMRWASPTPEHWKLLNTGICGGVLTYSEMYAPMTVITSDPGWFNVTTSGLRLSWSAPEARCDGTSIPVEPDPATGVLKFFKDVLDYDTMLYRARLAVARRAFEARRHEDPETLFNMSDAGGWVRHPHKDELAVAVRGGLFTVVFEPRSCRFHSCSLETQQQACGSGR